LSLRDVQRMSDIRTRKLEEKPLKLLKELYMITKYNGSYMPRYAQSCPNFSDKTANGLTKCVIEWIKLCGYQAERITVTGRLVKGTKKFTDTVGYSRQIGSDKWIKSSMQVGTADISATIRGKSVKIEVKIGKDRMSEAQCSYRDSIIAAGGIYMVVTSFEDFYNKYFEL
jgi:hypothetical protein